MTTTRTASAGRLDDVATLVDQLGRHMRLAHAYKTQLAAQSRDRAAHILLVPLDRLGPLRQGALAELMHADPSTVSRHVAALVEQGLVQRVADAADGRASQLVVTAAGRTALGRLRAEREALLAQVTAEWTEHDLTTFTTLFGRLLDGLTAALPAPSTPEETR